MSTCRIIFFTKYTWAGASSRYRTFQYLPFIQSAGFEVSVHPLLGDRYLSSKFAESWTKTPIILMAILRRISELLAVPRGVSVVIEYELFPFLPSWFESWLKRRGCRLIVDYDDALFHQYDQHPNPWVRRLLGDKIAKVMRLADAVVVGNSYLGDYARNAGARRVVEIPTVVDLARFPCQLVDSKTDIFTIGWIGSPTTARYLSDIAPALAEFCKGGRARVRLIGSGPVHLPGVPVEVLPWSEESEVEELCRFDIGIMPLPDEPWARGKCGFKLIQYMACDLPVIASPVGVNAFMVEQDVNGYLATTMNEWHQALMRLTNPEIRKRLGRDGRRKVKEQFDVKVTLPLWLDIISEVAQGQIEHR